VLTTTDPRQQKDHVATSAAAPTSRTRSTVMLAVTVLVVATNLRASITSVGPVIDLISADTGLGPAALGVLGAVPLLVFAVVSPLVHALSRRVGADRAVLIALVLSSSPPSCDPFPAGRAHSGSAPS
jgi:MFS transporter, CP family, cyanate transporter